MVTKKTLFGFQLAFISTLRKKSYLAQIYFCFFGAMILHDHDNEVEKAQKETTVRYLLLYTHHTPVDEKQMIDSNS